MRIGATLKRIRKLSQECIKRTGGVYLFKMKDNSYLTKGKGYHKVQNLIDRGAELIGFYDKQPSIEDMKDDIGEEDECS